MLYVRYHSAILQKKKAPKPLILSDFRGFLLQEQEDSNPRHLVLETNVRKLNLR